MNDQTNIFSFQAYHASGLKVFFAFPFASFTETNAAIEQALAAGFTVDPRGVEPGEMIEDIGYILRSTQVSTRDGTITPKIALYPAADHLQHKLAHYWLNTEDDIAAFEVATGLKLANIPIYPADNYPARDARSMQHFVKLPKPAKAVYKLNPAYTEGSTTEAKRHFVRWHSAAPAAPHTDQQTGNDKPATPKGDLPNLKAATIRRLTEGGFVVNEPTANAINAATDADNLKVVVMRWFGGLDHTSMLDTAAKLKKLNIMITEAHISAALLDAATASADGLPALAADVLF